MALRSAPGGIAREGRDAYVAAMARWFTALFALLALALGSSHAAAMAQMPVVPIAPVAATASADLPCHGDSAEAAPAEKAQTTKAPDCCPDGCAGGCLMLAAFWALPGMPLADAPSEVRLAFHPSHPPEGGPDGLKRPPRAFL